MSIGAKCCARCGRDLPGPDPLRRTSGSCLAPIRVVKDGVESFYCTNRCFVWRNGRPKASGAAGKEKAKKTSPVRLSSTRPIHKAA